MWVPYYGSGLTAYTYLAAQLAQVLGTVFLRSQFCFEREVNKGQETAESLSRSRAHH